MYDDLPIVDAHHHLWDLEGPICAIPGCSTPTRIIPTWATTPRCAAPTCPTEYRRDTALHNVVATVHIEAECDRSQQVAETRWLTGIAARHGMPNAIVAHAWIDDAQRRGDHRRSRSSSRSCAASAPSPSSPTGPTRACAGSPAACRTRSGARACRCWRSTTCRGTCAWCGGISRRRPRSCASIRACGPCSTTPAIRSTARRRRSPIWRRGMEALAACPNVACKISGLTVKDEPWTLAANKPHHPRRHPHLRRRPMHVRVELPRRRPQGQLGLPL